MTAEQMRDKILETAARQGDVSMAHISIMFGPEGDGSTLVELPSGSNIFIAINISETLAQALELCRQHLDIFFCPILINYMDGGKIFPDVPIAQTDKRSYKKPHYLPVLFKLRDRKL